MISAIVATDNNGVIGKDNSLPWNLPSDLAHFRATTAGHPVIMGRKTHEAVGRVLPDRQNIIITHYKNYRAEGCDVVNSFEDALKAVKGGGEIFIIGGQAIYELAMPKIERIYLTRVDANIPGDRYFKYDPKQWQEISSEKHQPDKANKYAYEFVILERRT